MACTANKRVMRGARLDEAIHLAIDHTFRSAARLQIVMFIERVMFDVTVRDFRGEMTAFRQRSLSRYATGLAEHPFPNPSITGHGRKDSPF